MDYIILAVNCRRQIDNEWECLVAIDAGNNYWKVYRKAYSQYPEWSHVLETATLGGKVPQTEADALFPDLAESFGYYGA